MASLSRGVIKWLQSLDLSAQVKSAKWDLSNGYIIAEILSWYYSQEIMMHCFINGLSLESKLKNWYLLKEFFRRHEINFSDELIEGVIHQKEDAAIVFINHLYSLLTNNRPENAKLEPVYDDSEYQKKLNLLAKSNATKAVKNNLSITELKMHQDILTNQKKVQTILHKHLENRAAERINNPRRFGIRMSSGERCLRRHPGPEFDKPNANCHQKGKEMTEHLDADGDANFNNQEAEHADPLDRAFYEEARQISVNQKPKH